MSDGFYNRRSALIVSLALVASGLPIYQAAASANRGGNTSVTDEPTDELVLRARAAIGLSTAAEIVLQAEDDTTRRSGPDPIGIGSPMGTILAHALVDSALKSDQVLT